MKWLTLIIVILLLIMIKYQTIATKMKHHEFKPDILVTPCGFYGIYNLGICHYIKNHFDLTDKKIAGLSSGSFNAFFLCLKEKKQERKLLKIVFRINNTYSKNVLQYSNQLMNKMNTEFKINELNTEKLYIGLSHPNDLTFYNNFTEIYQLASCCMGSSFIPGITNKKIMYFYKNRYTLDGGIWYNHYKKHIDENKTLIISPKMFGRFNVNIVISIFKNFQLYQLYIIGYQDAKKNHDYFNKYFTR